MRVGREEEKRGGREEGRKETGGKRKGKRGKIRGEKREERERESNMLTACQTFLRYKSSLHLILACPFPPKDGRTWHVLPGKKKEERKRPDIIIISI